MEVSSGALLYRTSSAGTEVLLVHPSGNYNRHAAWSIPKGKANPGEELEQAARRETWEETGVSAGELTSLGSVVYASRRKRVHCFAGPAPENALPQCASWEVDRAEFLSLDEARRLIHKDQAVFLDLLATQLAEENAPPSS